MATETLSINFKASGDKDLIAAFKGIANAQKQLTQSSKSNDDANKKLTQSKKKINQSAIRLTARLKEQNLQWKQLGINSKVLQKAYAGSTASTEKMRVALKKATAQTRILGGAFSVLRSKILIASFGVGLVTKGVLDQVNAFAVQQKSVQQLAVAFGQDGARALDDYSSELQKVTTFGDEVTNSAMATIGMYGASVEATKILTLGTMDLATALDMDLNSAAQLVAKSIGSSTNALSRYGIEIDATASQEEKAVQVTAELERVFGGLSKAMANTTEGRLKQAQNAFGDLQETIGAALAPAVLVLAKGLQTVAEILQNPVFLGAAVTYGSIAIASSAAAGGVGAFSGATAIATAAQSAFNVVAKANPYVLVGSLLLGAATAVSAYAMGTKELTAEQKANAEALAQLKKEEEDAKQAALEYADSVKQVNEKLERKLAILKATSPIERFALENNIKLSDVNQDLFDEYQKINAELKSEEKLMNSINKFYNKNIDIRLDSLNAIMTETEFLILNREEGWEKATIALEQMKIAYDELHNSRTTNTEGQEELLSLTKEEVALFDEFAGFLTNIADRRIESLQAEFSARMEISNATISQINQEKDAELAAIDDIYGRRASTHGKRLQLEKQTIAKNKEKVDAELQNQEKIRKETNKALVRTFRIKQAADISGTIIATQRAYMETLAAGKGFFGIPLAKIVAAQGALAVAAIAAQKPPKMQYGGLVGGQPHSRGGTMIEAERGEFVVNRNAVDSIGLETLNKINQGQSQGTVNISFQGNVLSKDFLEDEAVPQIKEALRRGGDIGVN